MPGPGNRFRPVDKSAGKGGVKLAFGKIAEYVSGHTAAIVVSLVMAALGAVLTLVGPNRIGDLTNIIKDGLMTGIDMGAIARIGGFLLAVYVLSALLTFAQHYILAVVTLKTSKRMRGDLSEKINRVPMKYFNTVSQGDVLSRITNDVTTLQQALSNSLPTMVSAATQFIGCLVMMFVTEWRLALCVIGVSLLGFAAMILIMAVSQKFFVARQESLGRLNGYVEEIYSGHSVVRISLAGQDIKENFSKLNERVYNANWKSQFLSGSMHPIMNITGNLGYVAVCVVGAALALNGTISFGTIISFILYARLFSNPLTQMAQGMTNMQTASAAALRVFNFLESEEMEKEEGKLETIQDVKGAVEFDHVKFAYPDSGGALVIKDFSATIKPGQKVAIVGPTGAGKTTLVNLLMRFFEVNSGSITVDGVPLTDVRRRGVHSLFGMVLQDTWLFEGTVRENLVYNMEGVTDEDLERVCRACGIDKFIHHLPQGFDTVLSEHTNVSAGQKQLMTIARAMLQNSPMLILDEATSSVDTRTELIIQRAMDTLTKGRTSFVIAHRLSTIRNADLILVMREGDIVESGSHEELLKLNGFYAQLYNSQFEETA